MKIILASKSPRRKEILSMITNNFEIIVSNVEEKIDEKFHITTYNCECGEISVENKESHTFENGKCVCGFIEVSQ